MGMMCSSSLGSATHLRLVPDSYIARLRGCVHDERSEGTTMKVKSKVRAGGGGGGGNYI